MQWPRWSETVLALVALAAAGLIGFGIGGARSGVAKGRLTVTAAGSAQVAPNLAQISLGANVRASTPQAAMNKLTSIAHSVVAAVEKDGVAAKDVQTSNLNVNQYFDQKGQPSGYQANEQFTVTVRTLRTAGSVISDGIAAGANQFNSVRFSSADPNAGRQTAVQRALQAARKQAKAEAKELGVSLGRVVSVQVVQQNTPRPVFAAQSAATAAEVQPGNQTVSVQVQVAYSFQ